MEKVYQVSWDYYMNYPVSYSQKVASLTSGVARIGFNRVLNAPTSRKAFSRASNTMKLIKHMLAAKRVMPEAKASIKDLSKNLVDPTTSLEE